MLLCERIIALVFALGLLLAGALGANAQSAQNYEAALAGFTKDSFNDTDSAIGAVAASGNPLAIQVIEALQDGRLSFSGDKVFIKDKAGATLDAATGKLAAAPADAAPVRLNNRLRRSVEAYAVGAALILGGFGLVAKTLVKIGVQPDDAPFLLTRRDRWAAFAIGAVLYSTPFPHAAGSLAAAVVIAFVLVAAKTADQAWLRVKRCPPAPDNRSIFFDSVSAVVINALRKHKWGKQRLALQS